MSTISGSTSAFDNYLAVQVKVTSGGSPISGASVKFSDSLGSSFTPAVATTDSAGVALTVVQFTNGCCPSSTYKDVVTAEASMTGYASQNSSTTVNVLQATSTQLSVTASLADGQLTAASSDVLSGYVNTGWGVCCGTLAGATVRITDSLGSNFSSTDVITDQNGYYFVNFTLPTSNSPSADFITVSASDGSYTGSSSTIIAYSNPSSSAFLSTNVRALKPSDMSAFNNYAVVETQVSSGGIPVSGASVTFRDLLNSPFTPTTGITDSNGVVFATVHFTQGCCENALYPDIITATASKAGYASGIGSNTIGIFKATSTQLSITASLTNGTLGSGGTDVVSGYVNNGWGVCCGPLSGVTVTIGDTLGSNFNSTTLITDENGYYAASFRLPSVGAATDDFVTVSASDGGYSGSSSTISMLVVPLQPSNSSNTNTANTNTISANAKTSTVPGFDWGQVTPGIFGSLFVIGLMTIVVVGFLRRR